MTRLLFYTHSLADGGAERLWARLASAFKARGYDVVFVQDYEDDDNRASLDQAVPLVTLGRGHVRSVLRLACLLKERAPDVALAAVGASNVKLLAARLIARSPVKVVLGYHGFDEHRSGWLAWAGYAALPLMSRLAQRTVAVSHALRDALVRRWGAVKRRTVAIHNPVFFPEAAAVPARAELAAREELVLALGRLVPEKDYVTLLRAFALLDRPAARLLILGQGPDEGLLKAEIERLGLGGRVELAGYAREPWAAYERARCLVSSSRTESFGNVLVEAMAYGLPVAATATPGALEILDHGRHGHIAPIGDPVALARAIGAALDDTSEPSERRARADEFSFAARFPVYEELVRDVIAGSAPTKGRAAEESRRKVFLDLTHLDGHVTGLERVAIELFAKAHFRGAEVVPVRSKSVLSMVMKQQLLLPLLALAHPRAEFVFPGFPPSPLFVLARRRVVLYVHDLFLLTRREDLNLKAKLYLAPSFRLAVRGLKRFLVNSERTRAELEGYAAPDAAISLYRPAAANVFGLYAQAQTGKSDHTKPLKILALGTIEPRKNYRASASIVEALARAGFADAELHIIGRPGWGPDADALARNPRIRLHGYLSAEDAKRTIEQADLFLSTSHDEGLGLPLLEVQFAGLPVVAPDAPIFREVLGASGLFIDPGRPDEAAARIAALVGTLGWRRRAADAARANIERWNLLAAADAAKVAGLFEAKATAEASTAPADLPRSPDPNPVCN